MSAIEFSKRELLLLTFAVEGKQNDVAKDLVKSLEQLEFSKEVHKELNNIRENLYGELQNLKFKLKEML